jgi:hypothetical protein
VEIQAVAVKKITPTRVWIDGSDSAWRFRSYLDVSEAQGVARSVEEAIDGAIRDERQKISLAERRIALLQESR